MISDFLLNPSIQGLRANNFGSGRTAIPVSHNQSIVDLQPLDPNEVKPQKTTKEQPATTLDIAQEAYALSLSAEGKALLSMGKHCFR